jgi:hypothetical protein
MPKGPPEIRREEAVKEIGTYLGEHDIKLHEPYTIISNDGETHRMIIIKKENHRPLNDSEERPSMYKARVDGRLEELLVRYTEELPVKYRYLRDGAGILYEGKIYGIINDMEGGKRKKTRRFKRRRRSYRALFKK